jgi:calcineurin-like phosphoesterase
MTDAGMTGDYESIIGMDREEPLGRFLRGYPAARYAAAEGPGTLSGIALETDDATGLATAVAPVRIGPILDPVEPDFWTKA